MLANIFDLGILLLVCLVVGSYVRGWWRMRTAPTALDGLKNQYARGELTDEQFESKVALHVDERNAQIRAAVEQVAGIGEDLSGAIATQFESLDELQSATPEDLEIISGIGEQRAEAIVRELR